jgi:hypothetical protein
VEHSKKCRALWKNDTPRGMASSFHTYLRRHTIKLVYRLGTAQRNFELDSIATKFYSHFLIQA